MFSILKAIAFVSFLFSIEYFSTEIWLKELASIPKWLINFQQLIPKPTYPDDRDAVIELISVIASVTGVILALFYPILATIASTAYAKVHASIRNLLLYEKETQSYLRRLTYLTACSIVVLTFLSFHLLPGNLVISFLAFYSFTTLFGILNIGLGIYNFFEPSTLAKIVFSKLTDSIKNVTTGGEYWNDKNFQIHNYKNAFEQTENLNLITSLCLSDENIKESSFKSSIEMSFHSLHYYLIQKPKIPIDSLWFPNVYSHLSYFESDMTLRDLSMKTYTYIQPKRVQNYYWLEERILNGITAGLETVVKRGHVNLLSETIQMSYPIFKNLGVVTDIKMCETILVKFKKNVYLIANNANLEQYSDLKNELGCIEVYCYAILEFQISILDTTIALDANTIISNYNKIDWNKKESIYSTSFIPDLHELLSKIQKFMQNEKTIEGRSITPDWYYIQLLASEYLKLIYAKINNAIKLVDAYLISVAKHFDSFERPLLSSFTVHIILEIIYKIEFRVMNFSRTLNDFDQLEVCKGEFSWIKPDEKNLIEQIDVYKNNCLSIISNNIGKISNIYWDNHYPDIYAQSYSLLSTELNKYLCGNNLECIKMYFPSFLKSALSTHINLNNRYRHYNNPLNISYQTLHDIMEISGYAYIYSAIFKNPEIWLSVKSTWDNEFEPTRENIKMLVLYYKYYKENIMSMGINYINTHQRVLSLKDTIEYFKLKPKDIDNLLVKPYLRDSSSYRYNDIAELFIEIYLFTFISSKESTELFRRDIFDQLSQNIERPNPREYDDFWNR